jgi:hypothetical protein
LSSTLIELTIITNGMSISFIIELLRDNIISTDKAIQQQRDHQGMQDDRARESGDRQPSGVQDTGVQ